MLTSFSRHKRVQALVLLTVLVMASFSRADISVEQYVAMDLQARQITLDGVRVRLNLLQSGAPMGTQLQHDEETQRAIEALYARYELTPSKAVAWSSHHADTIGRWLQNHPDYQARYEQIAAELDAVSSQIQTLVNP